MSPRSRLLTALLALTLIPLVGVGVLACVHAFRWSAEAYDARLARTAERAAADVTARRSELVAFLEALGTRVGAQAPTEATRWWAAVSTWSGASEFSAIEVQDAAGLPLFRTELSPPVPACAGQPAHEVRIAIRPGAAAGAYRLVGDVSAARLLDSAGDEAEGRILVLDRATGERVFDAACAGLALDVPDLPLDRRGRVSVLGDTGPRKAWYVNLTQPAWSVVSAPASGWPAPFSDAQLSLLVVVMALALASGGAFVILIAYLRRSLDVLTSAAVRIGQGDFAPWLPPPGEDEVGRLSHAIGAMAGRLRERIHQDARTRQMAAIGELASHVSHEIRNPLSSLKLNLQSVERELAAGSVPADLPQVLQLCMREIHRLDGTVQAVLRLAGVRQPEMKPCRIHALLGDALAAAGPQIEERGIDVRIQYLAADDRILGDATQLRNVFLNLFSNAVDAMPQGGRLRVWTTIEREGAVRIRVADDGNGVAPELRDRIFRPFFTTRNNGSGIGLPLAQQTVEVHRGRLWLETRSELDRGAEFVVELPLVASEAADIERVLERAPARAARRRWIRAAEPIA